MTSNGAPLNFLDTSSTLPRHFLGHFLDTSSTLPRHFLDTSRYWSLLNFLAAFFMAVAFINHGVPPLPSLVTHVLSISTVSFLYWHQASSATCSPQTSFAPKNSTRGRAP